MAKQFGASKWIVPKVVSGLPVPENTLCQAFFGQNINIVIPDGPTFTIPVEKLVSVAESSDVDIQRQNVSSVGGAIAGAMVAGPIGAAIGGRTKEKVTRTIKPYIVITYNSDGIKTIYLDVSYTKYFDITKMYSHLVSNANIVL